MFCFIANKVAHLGAAQRYFSGRATQRIRITTYCTMYNRLQQTKLTAACWRILLGAILVYKIEHSLVFCCSLKKSKKLVRATIVALPDDSCRRVAGINCLFLMNYIIFIYFPLSLYAYFSNLY